MQRQKEKEKEELKIHYKIIPNKKNINNQSKPINALEKTSFEGSLDEIISNHLIKIHKSNNEINKQRITNLYNGERSTTVSPATNYATSWTGVVALPYMSDYLLATDGYSGATSRTNSNRYNPGLTFNDNSMITSVSTDNKNVYL